MVTPVTSFSKSGNEGGGTTSLGYRYYSRSFSILGNRQKTPFNLVLPYSATYVNVLRSSHTNPASYSNSESWDGAEVSDSVLQTAVNKAYGDFVNSVKENEVELAVFLAELNKTAEMVTTRLLQMCRMLKAAKKGDLDGFLKHAAMKPGTRQKKNMKGAIKESGSFWLETWWGWKPLIQDINGGVELFLEDPFLPRKVRGRGKDTGYKTVPDQYEPPDPNSGLWSRLHQEWFYSARAQTGGRVAIENPNKVLQNQLGLTNPAAWAWELTPWSAVVDWGLNVSQVINSLTDLYGYTITQAYTTTRKEVTAIYEQTSRTRTLGPTDPETGFGYWIYHLNADLETKRKVVIDRTPNLASPKLVFVVKGFSPYRMMTAASLLTTFLR
jgi:hypothetical protein